MKRILVFFLIIGLAMILSSHDAMGQPAGKDEPTDTLPDLHDLWDYSDPAGTRAKFEVLLPAARAAHDQSYHLQLLTQIARTLGLESEFDRAHQLLDSVETTLTAGMPRVKVRYLLERGRAYRSSGEVEKSHPLFVEAFTLSNMIGADFFTVDAAHMVAQAATAPAERMKWNLIGVGIAEKSKDERARGWLGSLYNNVGWDYFDRKAFQKAHVTFEKALAFRKEQGNPENIRIAKWCVAKSLRLLQRIDEALEIQEALLTEMEEMKSKDGYIFEELGELYLVNGDIEKSRKFFTLAYEELSQDTRLVNNESARLERLKKLGQDAESETE